MNNEELLQRIREEVQGSVAPIEMRLSLDPWRDQVHFKSHEHKIHHADGGGGGTTARGFPWGSNYVFGITDVSTNGDTPVYKIKVWNGRFRRWGDQCYEAADTEVTFEADGDQYIVWKWSQTYGLEIQTNPQTNWPAESDSTYIYGVVHKVNLTAGAFTLLESVQTGVINAPIFTVAGT